MMVLEEGSEGMCRHSHDGVALLRRLGGGFLPDATASMKTLECSTGDHVTAACTSKQLCLVQLWPIAIHASHVTSCGIRLVVGHLRSSSMTVLSSLYSGNCNHQSSKHSTPQHSTAALGANTQSYSTAHPHAGHVAQMPAVTAV
jgi:hypothetical protein